MDRGWLDEQLSAGRSIESIAREVDRHPSTVSYWIRKHGLTSSHTERYAPRGGIDRDLLTLVVATGVPVRDIAEVLDRSPTTVRYWLRRYELTTGPADRRARVAEALANGEQNLELSCDRHGRTRHTRRVDGSRCTRCEAERATAWRQRTKRILVDEAGGSCVLCGYDRCVAALQFHHVDPSEKRFSLSDGGLARSLRRAREEARKCALLCANCHAEVEAGVTQLPLRSADPDVYPA